jgi:acyl-CoA thioester hydrolase
MEDLLKEYPVIIEIPVAWGEMDALQHVNNIVYFRYFESVRVGYLEKIDFLGSMTATGIGPILAETRCRYKVPVTFPDILRVGARTHRMAADRFFMSYAAVSKKCQKIAAVGEAEVVAFDYRNNVKAEIPEAVRKRISMIEGGL